MAEYTKERRIEANKKRVPDQDVREIRALLEKRADVITCIRYLEDQIKDLKRQKKELELKQIADDFGICKKIVNKINRGIAYNGVK